MYDQKSEVAHPLRQSSPDGTVERGLTGLTKHAFITATHEQLTIRWCRHCKKKLSRVQYNLDVVKRTRKLQGRDAV